MQFEPALQHATLIRRYKRFLADVETPDGQLLTIHCPNTGAMTGCAEPGFTVWYSTSANLKRKYPHTWELSQTPQGDVIVVNTLRANQIAELAFINQQVDALQGYATIQREVKYGSENSRIDLLLSNHPHLANCYVEVKSVTLHDSGGGYFPDAVTVRGQKHIRELIAMVKAGHRAALLFVVGHSAINDVKPAAHIDPVYARLCIEARDLGVEILALNVVASPAGLMPGGSMDVII
ncbi:MAG: DNA/RNA nuclease SfsA [Idiomarina sp.]|nr:DNA/RNA nuclease SfsA [Idiomarina sp.]